MTLKETTSLGRFLSKHFPNSTIEELANKFHADLPFFTDWLTGSAMPPKLAIHIFLKDFAMCEKEIYQALYTNRISFSAKLLDVSFAQIEEWDEEFIELSRLSDEMAKRHYSEIKQNDA